MTTHEGHDHPNTKAGRAACRKAALQGEAPKTTEQASRARHPSGKARAKKTPRHVPNQVDPAMPHEFDPVIGAANKCYVCGRLERASIHGDDDGAGKFVFDKSGKLTGLRLW